ncbi:helix-turn-helix transcriptional regulator [Oceanobacillus kapialis]|uniref:Helix-turn-helix transcriptional regulator n=1 Tax=Oceanobacillus kapialis TaxID=481353 RepID=A0ABW5Q2A9_9BACI
MKLERLLSIIFKLLHNEMLSASSLANEFEVSTRTIYRDIEAICAAGIPVVSYQGTNGGFGIIKGYKIDKSLMGPPDIRNVVTVLNSLVTIFKDREMEHTIDRLSLLDRSDNKNALSVDLESYQTEPNSLKDLRKATNEKLVIHFEYVSNKNVVTSREIEPIQLQYKYRNWYLYAFCRERHDYREFRVSRMMRLTVTQETFQQHHDIKHNHFNSGNHVEGFEEVIIWVHPNSLAAVLDQFQNSTKLMNDDGSMRVSLSVYEPLHAGWLRSILLSFGAGVKIMKPVELQSVLTNEARKIIKLYEDV